LLDHRRKSVAPEASIGDGKSNVGVRKKKKEGYRGRRTQQSGEEALAGLNVAVDVSKEDEQDISRPVHVSVGPYAARGMVQQVKTAARKHGEIRFIYRLALAKA
jgi:hypothetical protein